MPDQYYYSGRSGESFVGERVHVTRECPELPTLPEPRPIEGDVINRASVERCPECFDLNSCDVTMSNGETCGRDRPCPYHD